MYTDNRARGKKEMSDKNLGMTGGTAYDFVRKRKSNRKFRISRMFGSVIQARRAKSRSTLRAILRTRLIRFEQRATIGVRKLGKGGWLILAAIWIGPLIPAPPAAAADGGGALVRGTVRDALGVPVPRTQVAARDLGTGLSRSATSDSAGLFEIAELPPGSYQVEIAADGARSAASQRVELGGGEIRTLTFVLASGSRSPDSPPSESGAARPSSAATANLIRESQLVGLPLNGRSYSQLATLQSDVSDTATGSASRGTSGGNLTMAGGRSTANNFLLDGTSIMNTENGGPRSAAGVQLGSDAVLQVQVWSSYYGAEYGRSSGGVLNSITRSGTSELHGTFFEYFRNSKLDARNFFDRDPEPPPFKRNQFGFTLTGPLVKEKTFFMVSYEAMRDRLNETDVSFFPDELARQGDLGDGRIIPVAPRVRPYLDLYPIPNDISLGRGIGQNRSPLFLPTDENFMTVRLDQKLSERDSFFARYTFDDASSQAAEDSFLFHSQNDSRQQYLTLVGSHTLSPRTLTSFRFGYTRPVNTQVDVSTVAIPRRLFFVPDASQFGQIQIPGITTYGPNSGLPEKNILHSFQFSGDVFLQRGLHVVKLGFDIHRYRSEVFNYWGKSGQWSFNSLENFLLAGPMGTSLYVALPGSDNRHEFRQTLAGFYIQDEYRVRPRVQLSLGIRYEFVTQISDTFNRIPFLRDPVRDSVVELGKYFEDNPSLGNFAPRVAVSWSPGAAGSTTLSAGFGIYYDQILGYAATTRKNSGPFYRIVFNPNFDSSPYFPDAIAAAAGVPPIVQVMDYLHMRTPMVLRYNLTLRRQLSGGWQVQAAYGGARGNHLFRRYEANQFPVPITQSDGSLFFPPSTGPVNLAFGSLNIFSSDAQSFYNALQLSAGRSVGRGISLQASYTFGKSVDDSSTGSGWNTSQYGFMRTLDRGLSDFDLRHRLVFNYFYSLPLGGGQGRGVMATLGKALGGWRLGGIVSIRSGTPFTPQVNVRVKDYLFSALRPDLLRGRSNNPVKGVTEGCGPVRGGQPLGGPELYFDPCAFAAPLPGRLGNLGRNTVIASSVFSMDFSLQREFFLDAKKRLQFRAEVFNLPNHSNFSGPSPSPLTVFSGESGARNSTAGRFTRTATTARQLQLALRFSF